MLRLAVSSDIVRIMEIIDEAKVYFKEAGIDQWQNGYPNAETIAHDISNNESYVYESSENIVATLMISLRPEPTYATIDGNWSLDGDYATIHRIAVSSAYKGQGFAKKTLSAAMEQILRQNVKQIRIDTHEDNLVMINYLLSSGFKYCGIIELSDGNKRNAYDKII